MNMLNITINGRTYAIEFRSYDPQNPKATCLWNPLPPELKFVHAIADTPVYDNLSGNLIWIMPAETLFLITTFPEPNGWRWIVTVDGRHYGFIQLRKERAEVPFRHAKEATDRLPILHGYGCASIPGLVSSVTDQVTGVTTTFQLPICGQ